jgi:hypothetical protein
LKVFRPGLAHSPLINLGWRSIMKIIAIEAVTFNELGLPVVFQMMIRHCQKQMTRLFHPYQPWRHYMRGPGPKCREKQGLTAI